MLRKQTTKRRDVYGIGEDKYMYPIDIVFLFNRSSDACVPIYALDIKVWKYICKLNILLIFASKFSWWTVYLLMYGCGYIVFCFLHNALVKT